MSATSYVVVIPPVVQNDISFRGRAMTSKLTPILEIAREILKVAGLKGMHVDDIAAEAARLNKNLSLSKEEFSKKLQGALAANLNLKTQKPSFARVEGKKKGYPIALVRHGIKNAVGSGHHKEEPNETPPLF